MSAIVTEQRRWDRYNMKVGGMYRYKDIDSRFVLSEAQLKDYTQDIWFGESIADIDENDVVVILDKKILLTTSRVNGYNTFIKVLTKDGTVGWAIWFPEDWEGIHQGE